MRAYLIDELAPEDVKRIADRLTQKGFAGSLEGIYYLPVPEALLSPEQQEHLGACGPYIMPVETGDDWVRLELLVRARSILRCSCVAYAHPALREHMIDTLDALIKDLDIAV